MEYRSTAKQHRDWNPQHRIFFAGLILPFKLLNPSKRAPNNDLPNRDWMRSQLEPVKCGVFRVINDITAQTLHFPFVLHASLDRKIHKLLYHLNLVKETSVLTTYIHPQWRRISSTRHFPMGWGVQTKTSVQIVSSVRTSGCSVGKQLTVSLGGSGWSLLLCGHFESCKRWYKDVFANTYLLSLIYPLLSHLQIY